MSKTAQIRRAIRNYPHLNAAELADLCGVYPNYIRAVAHKCGLSIQPTRKVEKVTYEHRPPVKQKPVSFTSPPVYGKAGGTSGYVRLI